MQCGTLDEDEFVVGQDDSAPRCHVAATLCRIALLER
jgi:hypothetical protein